MKPVTRVSLLLGTTLLSSCRCTEDPEPSRDAVPTGWQKPSASPSASALPEPEISLEDQVRSARNRQVRFEVPTQQQRREYVAWLAHVAEAAWADELPRQPPPEGFTGRLGESGSVWLLGEQPSRKRGAGLVLLRPSAAEPIIVEAPHTFFEPETLRLAVIVFRELGARALLVNTAHRGGIGNDAARAKLARSGDSPSDVAHNKDSHFAAAHRALVALDPKLTTLQLHGFRDDAVPGTDLVLSAARSEARVLPMAESLRQLLGDVVRTYPDQVKTLGGTTNVEAALSRELKSAFFHIEMSASLRKQLLADRAFSKKFAAALGRGITGWE